MITVMSYSRWDKADFQPTGPAHAQSHNVSRTVDFLEPVDKLMHHIDDG